MKNHPLNIDKVCDLLGIQKLTKRVLLFLIEHNTDTDQSFSVVDISSNLTTPKSSIYDALDELIEKSLVIEYEKVKLRLLEYLA